MVNFENCVILSAAEAAGMGNKYRRVRLAGEVANTTPGYEPVQVVKDGVTYGAAAPGIRTIVHLNGVSHMNNTFPKYILVDANGMPIDVGGGVTPVSNNVLREDGTYMLREDGTKVTREAA